MKLTPLEIEILKHRLEVPDCIAQALADDYDEATVDNSCAYLLGCLENGFPVNPSPLFCDILAECVEASTYCGTMADEPPAKQHAAQRAAESLAKKIGELIGRELRAITS